MTTRDLPSHLWRWKVRRLLGALAILLAGGLLFARPVRAEDVIWVGLVLADNSNTEDSVRVAPRWPAALAGREANLSKIFGYNHFTLIGQSMQRLKTGEEDWLVPSSKFCLKVNAKHPLPGGGYLLNLQLWQEVSLLVETNVKLGKGGPLYIRGPLVGHGQLIIALVCSGKEAAWTKPKPKAAAVAPASTAVGVAPSASPAPSP